MADRRITYMLLRQAENDFYYGGVNLRKVDLWLSSTESYQVHL